jgi:hypothetical protein
MPRPDAAEWRSMVERSAFGLDRCIDDLHAIYREELKRRG